MTQPDANSSRAAFHALHQHGTFVMPNPHDIGTARILEAAGFAALATCSAKRRTLFVRSPPAGNRRNRPRHERDSHPMNVLLLPGGPTVDELGATGVRRVSLGSNLTRIAYGAFANAAQRLLETGGLADSEPYLDGAFASKTFVS